MTEPGPRPISTWQAAETNAAAWMCDWGFFDAKVTRGGADGGVDVISSGAMAQVKWRAAATGRPAVQALVGACIRNQDQQLFFFSSGGYTRQAVEYARTMNVALFTYDFLGQMTPESPAARRVLEESQLSTPPPIPSHPRPAPDNYQAQSRRLFWRAARAAVLAIGVLGGLMLALALHPMSERQGILNDWAAPVGLWMFYWLIVAFVRWVRWLRFGTR